MAVTLTLSAVLPVLTFPAIDPVLLQIGPIAIRWYALAYISGLVLGWMYVKRLASSAPSEIKLLDIDDFLVWATLGVILGGRLGFVIFYEPLYFLQNPLQILKVWGGGMSFHGGFLGVVVAGIVFCRKRDIDPFAFGDLLACAAPIGLFFGRIANFINGELWGRETDVPWAMVFPHPAAGPNPRHPSQLYEAALEGLLLFVVLSLLARIPAIRQQPGQLMGLFIAGYGMGRFTVEYFRQYAHHFDLGPILITHGQMYSLPMVVAGVGIVLWCRRRAA